MAEPVIHSALWKSVYLVGNSAVFPLLVEGACAYVGTPYSDEVLRFAATRPAILGALTVTESTSIDEILREYAHHPENAQGLDSVILNAVTEWKDAQDGDI